MLLKEIFDRLTSKMNFPDGTSLRVSGREEFAYTNSNGQEINVDVYFPSAQSDGAYVVAISAVAHSFDSLDGTSLRKQLSEKFTRYFEKRGQRVLFQ